MKRKASFNELVELAAKHGLRIASMAGAGYDPFAGHEFGVKGDPFESLRQAYRTCNV
jgi:hypothetical protein